MACTKTVTCLSFQKFSCYWSIIILESYSESTFLTSASNFQRISFSTFSGFSAFRFIFIENSLSSLNLVSSKNRAVWISNLCKFTSFQSSSFSVKSSFIFSVGLYQIPSQFLIFLHDGSLIFAECMHISKFLWPTLISALTSSWNILDSGNKFYNRIIFKRSHFFEFNKQRI